MKRFLIIVLAIISFFIISGCKEKLPIDYAKVNTVIEEILMLPDSITLSREELIISVRALYDDLNESEKALITNYNTLEEAELILETLIREREAELEEINFAFLETKEYLEEYLPETISENIDLPRTYDTTFGRVSIMWKSSNSQTLSNTGITNPGRTNITLTLIITLRFKNEEYVFNRKIKVEKITFDPLPQTRISFGYLYNRPSFSDLRPNEEKSLDVINYAFGNVLGGVANLAGLGDYQDVLALRKKGVRVVLCLGGYRDGAAPFSEACRTEEGRNTLVKSIVEAVNQYHYDGVDIDWEYPGEYTGTQGGITNIAVDSANYTAFMKELRKQLKLANPDYILSAALPGGPWLYKNFEIANLANVLDFFHLMTYDLDSADTSTHLTALYSSPFTVGLCSVHDSVQNYTSRGVAAHKIVIGIAFYGRAFYLDKDASSSPMKQKAHSRETIFQSDIVLYLNRVESGEVIRYFDDVAKAPYLYDTVRKVTVSYEDRESIMYKAQYAIENGFGGMMFWEYYEDSTGKLLEAIYDYYVKDR